MGFHVLVDRDGDRAVLYDSTAERPIDTCGFIGANAEVRAESFLSYLHTADNESRVLPTERAALRFDATDPRYYLAHGLEAARDRWWRLCVVEDTDELTPYGELLHDWWSGSRREPAPEPGVREVS